jgi:two-component system, NarL family, nitrate/nitrite response regulator NarL
MSSMVSSNCSQPEQPITILIVDRNCMTSQLLAESLDRDARFEAVSVVGTAATKEILSAAGARKPNVAVISSDFDGAPKKGLQVARALHANYPNVHIVMLLELSAEEPVVAAFRCGAKGVFCRSQPLAEFRACIERVSRGEIWASSTETEYFLEAMRNAPSCDGIESDKVGMLSHREIQVAERAAQGYSNKQIADQFQLSEHTVKNYLSRVFEKLGVSNRFELLFLLFKGGNGLSNRMVGCDGSGLGNSIETYLKAAEEGYGAAQFIVGLAHLDGYGVEKNGRSAYYWLRMAEENSSAVRKRSRALTENLRTKISPDEIRGLERRIVSGAQNDKILASEPVDLFKRRLSLLTDRQAG